MATVTPQTTLTTERRETLEDIGRVGSREAAVALSTLLKVPVAVRVVRSSIVPAHKIMTLAPPRPEGTYAAIYFDVYGEQMGAALFVTPADDARRIVDAACRRPQGTTKTLTEESLSALREIGNILVGAYLAAIRQRVSVPLIHSVPCSAVDHWGAIMDSVAGALSLAEPAQAALLIETALEIAAIGSECAPLIIAGQWPA